MRYGIRNLILLLLYLNGCHNIRYGRRFILYYVDVFHFCLLLKHFDRKSFIKKFYVSYTSVGVCCFAFFGRNGRTFDWCFDSTECFNISENWIYSLSSGRRGRGKERCHWLIFYTCLSLFNDRKWKVAFLITLYTKQMTGSSSIIKVHEENGTFCQSELKSKNFLPRIIQISSYVSGMSAN